MAGGKHLLGMPRGRHVFGTVKVGERGQIVIPKEARELFGIRPGVKKPAPQRDAGRGLQVRSAVLAHLREALAAVDRTIGLRLEGNTSLAAAVGADSGEVLSRAAGSILASVTAGLAALGLILEASLRIELLLTGGEHEFGAAFLAN